MRRQWLFQGLSLGAVALGFLLNPCARGQATFGNLIGTVTDPAGAVVAGARITITSVERGTVRSTTSNESGNYIQTHLDPGKYTVEFEMQGFQRMVRKEVEISIDRSTRLDRSEERRVGKEGRSRWSP